MAKTIFQHGTPVTPDWLNSINNPVFDGQDLDGHRPPLSDAELDSSPDSVKSRVETLADWLKVEHTSGLGVQWTAGVLRLANGTTLSIPGNVATLPDNATTYFYVRNGGTTVERGASIPANALRLAIAITADGAVTNITDLRASLLVPFDTLHGALSEQTQDLRDRLDTLAAATVDQIESLSAQVDSLESSQGDVLGGLPANLAEAMAGDVIVVGAGGTSLTRIPQTSLSTANASGIGGRPVSLSGATPGDILTIGSSGNIVSTEINSNEVSGIPFDLNGLDAGEFLGYNGSAIVPVGGNTFTNLGDISPSNPAYVAPNRSYLFNSLGSAARVIIPTPSKAADELLLVNRGTNLVTLDFATNAAGTDTGNTLMGSMASIDLISTGTTTKDWFYFPSPASPQGRVASVATGGGGSGSTAPLQTWAEVQAAWSAVTSTVTGGSSRLTSTIPYYNSLMVLNSEFSLGLVSQSVRKVNNADPTANSIISGINNLTSIRGCVLSDGRAVIVGTFSGVSYMYLYNPTGDVVTPIGLGGRTFDSSWVLLAYGMTVIVVRSNPSGTIIVDEYNVSTGTWTATVASSLITNYSSSGSGVRYGSDNQIWIPAGAGGAIAKYNPATKTLGAAVPNITGTGGNAFLLGVLSNGKNLITTESASGLYTINGDLSAPSPISSSSFGVSGMLRHTPLPDGRCLISLTGPNRFLIVGATGVSASTEATSVTVSGSYPIVPIPNGKMVVQHSSPTLLDFQYSRGVPVSVLTSPFFASMAYA